MPELLHLDTLPKLTSAQWRQVEKFLTEWKADVLAAAKRHPTRGFDLGMEQTRAFLKLLGHLDTLAPGPLAGGVQGPTSRAAVEWANRYTLRELDDSLDRYIGKIKDALLYGLRGAVNPTQLASWLYKATQDADVNWRMIARTEMVRANAAGRLQACRDMGYDKVWAPPHVGACPSCKRHLENQVFDLADVQDVTNFGRDQRDWKACIPLHPHCRHCWLPYIPEVYEEMQRQQQLLAANGLDDEKLDQMFDESGHLKPEYQDAVDWDQFKTHDPYEHALDQAVAKVAAALPPAQPHELLFQDGHLRQTVTARVRHWLTSVLGQEALTFTHQYLTGQALIPSHMPTIGEPRAHLALTVDYAGLRAALPAYAVLSDPELHAALTTALRASLADTQVIPGVRLDAHVQHGDHLELEDRVRQAERPTWNLAGSHWTMNPADRVSTVFADTPVEVDAVDAAVHPEWVALAETVQELLAQMLSEHDVDKVHGAYSALTDQRGGARGRFVWDYLMGRGSLARVQLIATGSDLAKVFPGYRLAPTPLDVAKAAATRASKPVAGTPSPGTEHWITIHPHGQDEKGIPVLIRENGDGTASVIGGAGGHLTMLRLDRSKRIKPQKEKGADDQHNEDLGPIEHPVSEAEAQQQQQKLEADRQSAQQTIEHVKAKRDEVKQQLSTLIQDRFPDHDWDGMDHAARRTLISKLRRDSLRTLAHGPINRADANAAPQDLHPPDDVEDMEGGTRNPPADTDGDGTADAKESTLRPQTAMTEEDAQALQELFEQDRRLGKVAGAARKVIGGNNKGSSAWQMDWRPSEVSDAVAKKVEAEQRTQLARDLLTTADNARGGTLYSRAAHQGAFDTMDAVSHAILGHSVLTKEATELLGAAGSAQLIAHHLAKQVAAGGLDPAKIGQALNAITEDRERKVMDLGLARVQDRMAKVQEARQELAATKTGDSDWTASMAIATQFEASQGALKQLGGMIGGLEAMSGLKTALNPFLKGKKEDFKFAGPDEEGGKIKVGGFATPGRVKELAEKARVKVNASDISGERGAGNYTLSLHPDRLEHLLKATPDAKAGLLAKLKGIRTADDLDGLVQANRNAPGMSDTLDENQARGKMFLEAAGSGILAFDPGVGKTHVAIATAMQKMHDEPEKGHRALIVCPANMLASWAKTIKNQHGENGPHSVQIVGQANKVTMGDGTVQPLDATGRKGAEQLHPDHAADFNIISYEALPGIKHQLGGLGHTITIADELQKAKNENSGRFDNLTACVDAAKEDGRAFWGLSGTPIEKNVGDLHSMTTLARRARGEEAEDHKSFRDRHKATGQDEHIARTDKVAQFREGVDDSMFRLTAANAGNDLGEPAREAHKVELHPEQAEQLRAGVTNVNARGRHAQIRKAEDKLLQDRTQTENPDEHAKIDAQLSTLAEERHGIERAHKNAEQPVKFGGRQELLDTLYNHPKSALQTSVADAIDKAGSFDFGGMARGGKTYEKGDHAGSYEHKHVVFSDKVKPLNVMQKELESRGIKVFVSHGETVGSGGSKKNQDNLREFLAHPGKAVLLTSDMNNAGVSLQFGDNGGDFQHGATHMHHLTVPLNNATIQQREARILRKGAAAGAKYHTYSADTPYERKDQARLEAERRTQDLAGNSEQYVADEKTARHHLADHGIKPTPIPHTEETPNADV